MAKRLRYSPEQIITKFFEAEVHLSQGKTLGQACKAIEINNRSIIAGAGNTGEWMSPKLGPSKRWEKTIG